MKTKEKTGARKATGNAQKNAPVRPASSGTYIVALTLAHEMAAAVGAEGEDFEDLVAAALTAGEWLAMVGRPGCWDTLQVQPLLRLLPVDTPFERGKFLLSLAGLLGYAGLEGHLSLDEACKPLAEIEAIAEDTLIRNYARTAARQVRSALRAV
jgi:hypothetical protein